MKLEKEKVLSEELYSGLYDGNYQSYLEKVCPKECTGCGGYKNCRITRWC